MEGRSLCAVTHLATARRQKNGSRHFGAYEKIDRLFFQGRTGALGRFLGVDFGFFSDLRPGKFHDAGGLADWNDLADLQRQGQSHRAGLDDRVQSDVRADFLHLFLLRRDDHLPRHDRAHGAVCPDLLASESL